MKISKNIEKLQQLSLPKSHKRGFRLINSIAGVFLFGLIVLCLLLTLYGALFLSKYIDRELWFLTVALVFASAFLYVGHLRTLAAIGKALPDQLPVVDQEVQHRNELLERIHTKTRIILWICIPPALAITAVLVVAMMEYFHRHWYITDHTTVVCASTNLPTGAVITYDSIGRRTVDDDKIPAGYIMPRDYPALLGHKLVQAVTNRQLLTWQLTDIAFKPESAAPKK